MVGRALVCILAAFAVAIALPGPGRIRTQTQHPRIYFGPADLAELRRRAVGSHGHLSRALRRAAHSMLARPDIYLPSSPASGTAPTRSASWSSRLSPRWEEIYGNNLGALAMHCLLRPADWASFTFTLTYMDRLAVQPSWVSGGVNGRPRAITAIASTLAGFSTALDLLYGRLSSGRRRVYLAKVLLAVSELHQATEGRVWLNRPTDVRTVSAMMAVLLGSLVLEPNEPSAAKMWHEFAASHLDNTMRYLNLAADGSLNEGISFGSYVSRAVTQHVYLARRHRGVDHTHGTWLARHFRFYLATVLPGYQRTVGIGDSSPGWLYGPESQLVFLDAFVLRNGSGNWLAQHIRQQRARDGPLEHSRAWRWATLLTEYLWYDASLEPKPPEGYDQPRLYVFPSWGVATFGGGLPLREDSTFVSFKSGTVGGRLAAYGDEQACPDHEHPDQNSFTFAPGGRPFISEALYGPKESHLNNVLVFAPSPTSRCNQPWEGQLGECGMLMGLPGYNDDGKDGYAGENSEHFGEDQKERLNGPNSNRGSGNLGGGELIAAVQQGDAVFASGEAVAAYSPVMRLRSVYRAIVLLDSQRLLVLDHVERLTGSPLTRASAFFHNLDYDVRMVLQMSKPGAGLSGILLDDWDALYTMSWLSDDGDSPTAHLQEVEQKAELKTRWTQFVNVTWYLEKPVSRMAYLIQGPSAAVHSIGTREGGLRFIESSQNGVRLAITEANGYESVVSIATCFHDPAARLALLGRPAFATFTDVRGVTTFFGLFDADNERSSHGRRLPHDLGLLVLGLASISGVTVAAALKQRESGAVVQRTRTTFAALSFLWLLELLLVQSLYLHSSCRDQPWNAPDRQEPLSPSSYEILPTAVLVALPGSFGAETAEVLFADNTDFTYLPLPIGHLRPPFPEPPFHELPFRELPSFPESYTEFEGITPNKSYYHHIDAATWFHLLLHRPRDMLLRALRASRSMWRGSTGIRSKLRSLMAIVSHMEAYPNARLALSFTSKAWSKQLPFLQTILNPSIKPLVLVRDPRMWLCELLCNESSLSTKSLRKPLNSSALSVYHVELAQVWLAAASSALGSSNDPGNGRPQVVRLEDLVSHPVRVAESVYRFLGLPLPPAVLARLGHMMGGGVFQSTHYGRVMLRNDRALDWHRLPAHVVRDVETICGQMMEKLGYTVGGRV
uniref:dermatan-sulfate epimerase-like protein isoform X2 n=1 Tax=Myxine glutinosa TaxID=7769 RepID=UPI00358E75A2